MIKQSIFATAVLALLAVGACKEDPIVDPTPQDSVATIDANTTELKGYMRGTLLSGKTYMLTEDLIIPENEELVIQPGVTVIAKAASGDIGPEITVHGSFFALGTKTQPILLSVPVADRTDANAFAGLWGGVQGTDYTKAIVLKWCRVEYLGGQGGPSSPRAGKTRYGFYTNNPNTEFILEDCSIYGCVDDVYRSNGGKIHIVRNLLEFCGSDGGDGFNMKAGTVGNMAFNLFIGGATNAYKVSNEGSSIVQTNINVYNNIAINSGYRRAGLTRGANINYEVGARGYAYNNIIANNKRGMRVLEDADLTNIKFDYNWYYGAYKEQVDEFIPSDAVTPTQSVLGTNNTIGGIGENDPMWTNVDLKAFTLAQFEAGVDQPLEMNKKGSNDYRLKASSPCLGKGTTMWGAVNAGFTLTGERGPSAANPSKDLGAFPADNSGNQYF